MTTPITPECSHPRPGRAGDAGTLGAQHPAVALVRRRRAGELVRRPLAPAPVRRPGWAGPRDQLRRRTAPPAGGRRGGRLEGTGAADAEPIQRRPAGQRLLPAGGGRRRRPSPRSTRSVTRRTDRRRPSSWPVPRERLDGLLALGPAAGVTIVGVVSQPRTCGAAADSGRSREDPAAEPPLRRRDRQLDRTTGQRRHPGHQPAASGIGVRPRHRTVPVSLRNTDGPRTRSGARRARAAGYLHLIRRHRVAAPSR